jgi:hypothetical protein
MSVFTPLSQIRHPARAVRTRRSDAPTRHEWVRELELIAAGLLAYFGVRAVTIDRAGAAQAHARSVVHLEHTLGIAREADLQDLVIDHHALVTLANRVYIGDTTTCSTSSSADWWQ